MANVWYIGEAQERTLNFGASTFTWNIWNGWSIPESAFTAGQLAELDADPGFLLGQTGPRINPPWSPDSTVGREAALVQKMVDIYNEIPGRLSKAALDATYAPVDRALPTGGATGQVPVKTSGGVVWQDPPEGGAADAEIFNTTPTALRNARAAAARSRLFTLGFAGDSITKGAGSSSDLSQYYFRSYSGLLRSMLASQFGDAGATTFAIDTVFSNGEDPRWSFSGTWVNAAGGPHNNSLRQGSNGATVTFTADADLFTIFYKTGPDEGVWTAQVGDAALQRVDANDTTVGYARVTVPVPNAKRGKWPLVITAPTVGNVSFFGIEASIGTSGVRVSMVGRGGAHASDFVQNATAIDSLTTGVDMPGFDLLGIFFGTNYQTVASYKTDMTTLINRQRARGGDVLIIAPYDNAISGVAEPISDFVAACYELATTLDAPLLDLRKRWGTYAQANAAPQKFYSDDRHPSPAGTADIASAIYGFLMTYVLGDLPRVTVTPAVQTVTVTSRSETLYADGITPPETIITESQTDVLFTDN
ncbi:esterase [Gordonia phage Erutan]|uniref:Esterase n=1 Tax=Gordonia phage Erutan TaxID=3043913 RepID=A0AA96GXB5_9CAUD|nr:esterase [Gordonia phage Erutan]